MKYRRHQVLGVDIGRVIISAADSHGVSDTSFLSGSEERALLTAPTEGAFDALTEFVQAFEGRVWLVSKCGPRIQALTRRWLEHHRFHELTGLPRENVRFCLKRPEKREHCERIGATHFVDDRFDVLENLRGLVPNLYWFGHRPASPAAPEWLTPVVDFPSLRAVLLSDSDPFAAGIPAAHAR